MLYVVRQYGNKKFVPLTGEDVTETHTIEINGVAFSGLNKLQYSVLKEMADEQQLNAQDVLTGQGNG
jgi:hypothetical protein